MRNNKVAPATDKGDQLANCDELQTKVEFSVNYEKSQRNSKLTKNKTWWGTIAPSVLHYTVLFILGLLLWGWLWLSMGDGWRWDGPWFRCAIVVVAAWAIGLVLQSITTLPPLLGSLLIGMLARNLGYLDMRDFTHIDGFLRKIYPVIILGKGSLGWDIDYMKANWKQISALGTIPWVVEVGTLASCVHYFMGHPWMWGLVLGTFYASVTGPIVMPNVIRAGSSPRRTQNWPQLVGTAGGIDTALSVGMYGVLFTYLFSEPGIAESYRYFKAGTAIFIGIALGVAWGSLAGLIPHSKDTYVVELRVLFVLFGAIFLNFACTYAGWGGIVYSGTVHYAPYTSVMYTLFLYIYHSKKEGVDINMPLNIFPFSTVAVLACNATAAHQWKKKGWSLNNNPATTAYRAMWSACEPAVFAYTGTFFAIDSSIATTIQYGFAILAICLMLRLVAASLTCRNMTAKERAFICCVWSTKSIVEAVLCPTAINILLERGGTPEQMRYAEDFVVLTVQEILVATPVAFLITRYLGPRLLKDKLENFNEETRA